MVEMPKGKRHGNLSAKASKIYEAIRREHKDYSKSKAARIANATVSKLKRKKTAKKRTAKRRRRS